MTIAREEIFGPCSRDEFGDVDEAIARATRRITAGAAVWP